MKEEVKNTVIKFVITSISLTFVVILFYFYTMITSVQNNELISGVKPQKNEDINILLVGMDIGDIENKYNYSARRTDTIMVLNYDCLNEEVKLVSIPRDTLIEVNMDKAEGINKEKWKINAAYALGGEEELVMQVENILGLNINYIFEINYQAFRDIIDAIGGVELTIEQDMYYDDDAQNLHINFKEGEVVNLNGEKAEEFFRWRQNNDGTGFENGDIDRIAHQQKFMNVIIDKLLDKSNIVRLPKLFKVILDNVETNMPLKEMVSLGNKLRKLNKEDFQMKCIYWEYADVDGQSFVVTDIEENKKIFK